MLISRDVVCVVGLKKLEYKCRNVGNCGETFINFETLNNYFCPPDFPRASVNMQADPMKRSNTPSMLRMQLCKNYLHISHPFSIMLTTINNMLLVLTAKQQANKLSIKDMQNPKIMLCKLFLSE